MLARRFTIVCLLVTLFGMWFAQVAAEPGRGRPGSAACLLGDLCAPGGVVPPKRLR
jgi:hypothetical protein